MNETLRALGANINAAGHQVGRSILPEGGMATMQMGLVGAAQVGKEIGGFSGKVRATPAPRGIVYGHMTHTHADTHAYIHAYAHVETHF